MGLDDPFPAQVLQDLCNEVLGESMPLAISLMPILAPSFDFCATNMTARMAYSQAFENIVCVCDAKVVLFLIKEFFCLLFRAGAWKDT